MFKQRSVFFSFLFFVPLASTLDTAARGVSGCRHQESSHTDSPASALTLLDLLDKAPRLLELLTPDAQKALSATSRSFHMRFIAQVNVITVTSEADSFLAVQRQWPELAAVILQHYRLPNLYCYNFSGTPPARALAHMWVSTFTEKATIFMLRPQHSPASEAAQAEQAAEQLLQQVTTKWPQLNGFALSNVRLHAWGLAMLANLTKVDWSLLREMSLTNCKLNSQGVSFLIQAQCPALRQLDLSQNCLDFEAMALLARGDWPFLTSLELSFNPSLDSKAIAHLSAARWPLERLMMSHLPFTDSMASALAKLQLPHLTSLGLDQTDLTAAAMSQLASADWPVLSDLTLSHSQLDAEAMHHLITMRMPALEALCIMHAEIDALGAYQLAQGGWPRLKDLNLSHNRLDANAVQHLPKGGWPHLQCLALAGNPFAQRGVRDLAKGSWPVLVHLVLDLKMLDRDTALLLGLDPKEMTEMKLSQPLRCVLARNVLQMSNSCWPSLRQIVVYSN